MCDSILEEIPDPDPRTLSFRLRKDLVFTTAKAFRSTVIDRLTDIDCLKIDFAQARFLDSSGLGVLTQTLQQLRAAGGRMVIQNPNSAIVKTLEITRVAQLVEIQLAAGADRPEGLEDGGGA